MSDPGMARLLARRLSEKGRDGTGRLSVASLRSELLPYPLCRHELPLATKAEYDVALLDLLLEPAMLEPEEPAFVAELRSERDSAEPGLSVLDDRSDALLRVGEALRAMTAAGAEGTEEPRAEPAPAPESDPEAASGTTPEGAAADPDAAASALPVANPEGAAASAAPAANPERAVEVEGEVEQDARPTCIACRRPLPGEEDVRFCPFCGEDQSRPRCAECERELETGWSFCPACGRRIDG